MAWLGILLAAGWIAFAYLGYPLGLWLLARLSPRPALRRAAHAPPLSLVVAARDAGPVLRGKLEATLALRYAGEREILVASDASSDDTDAIAESFAGRGVQLVRSEPRGGKEAAQAAAIAKARGEILVFTDAGAELEPDALAALVEPFADPSVGCVSSEDLVSGGEGEGAYVAYEMALRRLETEASDLIGLSGSLFAARRSLCDPWPAELAGDMRTALEAASRGLRAVSEPRARVRIPALRDSRREWERKVRTVRRGIAVLASYTPLLSPARGRIAFSLWGHKLARFTSPFALLALGACSAAAARESGLARLLLAGQLAGLALGTAALLHPPLRRFAVARLAAYFLLVNASMLVAWGYHLSGAPRRDVDTQRALSFRGRLPPLDGRIEEPQALLALTAADLEARLRAELARRTHARSVHLRRSGREALRVALRAAAARTGRGEVVLPAYTCWSVAAAAAAADLRVRLVDVDERGGIDRDALAALPLERAAAVVVCNLFGVAEPVEPLAALARAQGAWLVDDAAQSFGATASDGAAGARGDVAILSFGRGKPLQALGGGALLWREQEPPPERDRAPRPSARRAWLRARAWNLALSPPLFRALAAAPWLHVGETRFEPGFARGALRGDALVLCAHALERCDAQRERRAAAVAELASGLIERTRFAPILAPPGARGAYPRLAVRAPDPARRAAAVSTLSHLGVARLYPAPLDAIPALQAWRIGSQSLAGGRALSERLFTLPTHGALLPAQREELLAVLARLAPRSA